MGTNLLRLNDAHMLRGLAIDDANPLECAKLGVLSYIRVSLV
jgi:hypothetical protein